MKQTILGVLLLACVSMQAQEKTPSQHELAISYGYPTIGFAMNVDSNILCDDFSDAYYANDKDFGPLSLEYYYQPSHLVSFGGVMAFINRQKDIRQGGNTIGDITCRYFTLMPAVKFNWVRTKHFGLYSKIAAGLSYCYENTNGTDILGNHVDKTDNMLYFIGQLSLLGIEAGSRLRVFGELGLGVQGVYNIGLRYRF